MPGPFRLTLARRGKAATRSYSVSPLLLCGSFRSLCSTLASAEPLSTIMTVNLPLSLSLISILFARHSRARNHCPWHLSTSLAYRLSLLSFLSRSPLSWITSHSRNRFLSYSGQVIFCGGIKCSKGSTATQEKACEMHQMLKMSLK